MLGIMKAVVFNGVREVNVEDRPIPQIQDERDIVVKVEYTGLCGSDLHIYRGHEPSDSGIVMGHEFTGRVSEVGSAVSLFKRGDLVVCPFTISCGQCFYCVQGFSSRCEMSQCFGCTALQGAQAEYVRVPLADSTVMKAPEGIKESALVLMADIFPTGYFAAKNGLKDLSAEQAENSTVVLLGLGPVGLCALVNILDFKPKHLIAVDSVGSRLEQARQLGAEPWNFASNRQGLEDRIKEITSGRGADIVVEVVGHSSALKLGFDLLRPWGTISSVGVHNAEIPWSGSQAYGKNLRIQTGRCPVRSIFAEALDSLKQKQHLLGFMAENIMPLSQAVKAYDLFDKMQVQKVIFTSATNRDEAE